MWNTKPTMLQVQKNQYRNCNTEWYICQLMFLKYKGRKLFFIKTAQVEKYTSLSTSGLYSSFLESLPFFFFGCFLKDLTLGTNSQSQDNPPWFQQNFSFADSIGDDFYKTELFKSLGGEESLKHRYYHSGNGTSCLTLSHSQFKNQFLSFIICLHYKVDET